MDPYRSLLRFHDENVGWMSEYFLVKKTETRGGALRGHNWVQFAHRP